MFSVDHTGSSLLLRPTGTRDHIVCLRLQEQYSLTLLEEA